MACPKCGSAVEPEARFCSQCGQKLAQPCRACGHANGPDAKFCAQCGENLSDDGMASPAPGTADFGHVQDAERRQLTVMFCDMVGSTALAEALDPEDLREILRAYQLACTQVVRRYDGHIAQYLGDGLITYFGFPVAHEDDAQRAVRAGLDVLREVKNLDTSVEIAVRVGIATGVVVVSGTGDGDAGIPHGAVGETPNLAARIQALAAPNTIAIGENTMRLLHGQFELEPLGRQRLKGLSEPMNLYRVTGAGSADSLFEASHSAGATPMVGRTDEFELLMARWQTAKQGDGQVVLLSGEGGIGKSRITQALKDRLADEPHNRLLYQCSPYYSASALYPVIEYVERAANIKGDDAIDAKLEKLESFLAPFDEHVRDVAPLYAAMLSVPFGDRYPALDLTARQQKERTEELLTDHVVELSKRAPVLLILEDAHWIDSSTRAWLDLTINRAQDAQVLVVITYRPEFEPSWTAHPHVTTRSLGRLSGEQSLAMINRVTDGKTLPAEIVDLIVEKTDGVPLFVEELIKTVIESDMITETETGYELTGPLHALAVPATLQDSLRARLDRLAPASEIAQVGAAIGREFEFDLLSTVSKIGRQQLETALDRLVDAQLIFRNGGSAHLAYVFKHALVQDAAYESLLRTTRLQLHTRIAEALEQDFPEIADSEPELLAQHYLKSAETDRAYPYLYRSGIKLQRAYANQDAANYFRRALDIGRKLADPPVPLKDVYVALSDTQELLGDLAGAIESWRQAIPLIENEREHADALRNVGRIHEKQGFPEQAQQEYDAAFDLLRDHPKSREAGMLLLNKSWVLNRMRQFDDAAEHAKRSLAIFEDLGLADEAAQAVNNLAVIFEHKGDLDTALDYSRQCLDSTTAIGNKRRIGNAYLSLGYLHDKRGEPDAALDYFDQAFETMSRIGNRFGAGTALLAMGRCQSRLKAFDQAAEALGRALRIHQDLNLDAKVLANQLALAEVGLQLGDANGARQHLDGARARMTNETDPRDHAEAARLEANILILEDQPPDAKFKEAIELLRANGRDRDADAVEAEFAKFTALASGAG